jgi:Na+/H+ antiporter
MPDQVFAVGVALALAMVVSRAIAPRLNLPDAVLLVLFGVIASFVPGAPAIELDPHLVFLVFLPPLLYHAAFFSAPRETKENAGAIMGLAIGVTLVTTAAVALTIRLLIPDLGWAPAIALGAAVASTDPVAATGVLQHLGAPSRIVTILEGESLVNDGAALTIFALAIAAAQGSFTVAGGAGYLVVYVGGGILYGLVVGLVTTRLRPLVRDPNTQILVTLLVPYVAYIPAEQVHASGVLATVTAAAYLGMRGHGLLQPASRLQAAAFWSVLTFVLESVLFLLLGLQIRMIIGEVEDNYSTGQLTLYAGAIIAVVIGVRLVWQAFVPPLAARVYPSKAMFLTMPRKQRFIVGWCGLRGTISLAIVLSIPHAVQGAAFPYRRLLVFLTAAVILVTLIGGAVTLPPLLRALGVAASERELAEGILARRHAVEAALRRLDEAAANDEIDEDTARAMRQLYELRLDRLRAALGEHMVGEADQLADTGILRLELVQSQREVLRRLYAERKIGSDTLRELDQELDVEASRFGHRK